MTNQPPIQRLTKRAQFLRVRAGFRAGTANVGVEALRREPEGPIGGPIGVGFTASKKVGNAVARNRAKRRLREAARRLLPELGVAGVDYVLVARQSTPGVGWATLLDDLGNALIRLRAQLERGENPATPARKGKAPRTEST